MLTDLPTRKKADLREPPCSKHMGSSWGRSHHPEEGLWPRRESHVHGRRGQQRLQRNLSREEGPESAQVPLRTSHGRSDGHQRQHVSPETNYSGRRLFPNSCCFFLQQLSELNAVGAVQEQVVDDDATIGGVHMLLLSYNSRTPAI